MNNSRPRRAAIVEDHLLQRKRTTELLSHRAGLKIVWSGETLPAFVAWLTSAPAHKYPHLLVLDLMVERQPSVDPADVKKLLNAGIRILVLSALSSPPLVRQVMRAGVHAVVSKRDSETSIVSAVRTVLRDGQWITSEIREVFGGDVPQPSLSIQEEQALVLYTSGLTLNSVAEAMGVRPGTAKKYLTRVKAKYAEVGRPANTKIDLSRVAWQDGYIEPPRS